MHSAELQFFVLLRKIADSIDSGPNESPNFIRKLSFRSVPSNTFSLAWGAAVPQRCSTTATTIDHGVQGVIPIPRPRRVTRDPSPLAPPRARAAAGPPLRAARRDRPDRWPGTVAHAPGESAERTQLRTSSSVAWTQRLGRDLVRRGRRLGHDLVRPGRSLGHDLGRRGGIIGQDLVRRGRSLHRDLVCRG